MGPQNKDRAKTTPAITCIKILLHIYNLIYLIIGACVLGVGVWTKIELSKYFELTELYYQNAPYIMIGVGALILLVAFGGFFCTAKDKIALLYMYAVFIVILAVLQIAAGIAGAVMKDSLTSKIETGLNDSLKDHVTKDNMESWNTVQQKLKCCGVNKPSDWLPYNGNKLPASCFSDNKYHADSHSTKSASSTTVTVSTTTKKNVTTTPTTTTTTATPAPITTTNATKSPSTPTTPTTTTTTTTTTETPTSPDQPDAPGRKRRAVVEDGSWQKYDSGCLSKIQNKTVQYLGVIVGVCVGFVFLQIMGAVLACCLAKRTSKNNYEQIY